MTAKLKARVFSTLRISAVLDQKDLVLIYRQSVPVNELDKPHNQTLIVCFFDLAQQKYVKNFEDEGGTIHWIKVVKDRIKRPMFLLQGMT